MCNLSWTPHSNLEKDNSLKTTPVLAQRWAVAETSLISWTFRPQNVNDSANKYECFGQINYIAAEMSLTVMSLSHLCLGVSLHVSGYHSLHFCQTYLRGLVNIKQI